jgi:putative endonuclease
MRDLIVSSMKQYFVYILASKPYGVLYIGVTGNLIRRGNEYRKQVVDGFTKRYFVHRLVYYEITNDIRSALEREKQLKKWKRQWKIELINKMNPKWKDLFSQLI